MNPQTLALIVQLLQLGERAYLRIREVLEREQSGNPLTDDELAGLQQESDSAHAVIQAWSPGAAAPQVLPPLERPSAPIGDSPRAVTGSRFGPEHGLPRPESDPGF